MKTHIADFEKYLSENNYSSNTRKTYLAYVREFATYTAAVTPTLDTLGRYREHVAALGISTKTKNLRIMAVRTFLSFFNEKNPRAAVAYRHTFNTFKLRHNSAHEELVLPTEQDVPEFLDRLEHHEQTYLIARIMLASGMRISEVMSLRSGQVSTRFHVTGKGTKQRPVYCTPEVVDMVKAYEAAHAIPVKDRLFKISTRMVQTTFRETSNGSITPHTLRHIFATRTLQSGVDIRIVQRMLGHSSIMTTERYLNISDEYVAKEYERVMSILPTTT